MSPRVAALVAVSAAALGCGETLVDHRAPDLFLPPPESVTTIITGDCNTVNACGPTCSPCDAPDPATVTTGYASAERACYGPKGASFCGYACTGGLIKCPTGCCQAQTVQASAANSCAVTTDGGLYCWGDNARNQIADVAAAALPAPVRLHDANVSAVAVGESFTCAVVSGAVSCRGSFKTAGAVPSPAIAGVVQLAAGADHVCARTSGGAVRCWGSNDRGQRGGPGVGTPLVATPVASGATSISAGTDHACAVVAGSVSCWGSRAAGQLGDGGVTGFSSVPVAAGVSNASGSGIGAISAGALLSCAAPAVETKNGGVEDALQCWGTGLGSLLAASPQTTPAIPLKDANTSIVRFQVDQVAVGRAHVCVKRNGALESVKCLGSEDGWGQLGGTVTPGLPPEALNVSLTQDARAFALGADHGCAVQPSGAVVCWGRNSSGQLGDGSQQTPGLDDARTFGAPVPVSGR